MASGDRIPRYRFRLNRKIAMVVAICLFYGQAQILIAIGAGNVDGTFFGVGTAAAMVYAFQSELHIWIVSTVQIVRGTLRNRGVLNE